MEEPTTSYCHVFNFIIIGDAGVGKSCILEQFIDGRFTRVHDTTIGVDFKPHIINIYGLPIKLKIYDTAGLEAFRSITHSFYRNSHGVLLVYDITMRETFSHLRRWLVDIQQYANSDTTIMLIGNKCDLERKRVVTKEEGEQFAKEHGLIFLETSARTSQNVAESFLRTSTAIHQKIIDGKIDLTQDPLTIKLGESQRRGGSKRSCCTIL